jgi:endonuclease G, mitochondrial
MRRFPVRLVLLAMTAASQPFGAAEALRIRPQPMLPSQSRLLENLAYETSFNFLHKQADWVFYGLGKWELRHCVERSGPFRVDTRLKSGEGAEVSDYSGSGFDRGHLSPAADNRWSPLAMRESFLMTNVSPQNSRFNSGIWARLESLVRAWASEGDGLWVATGPLLKRDLPTIGNGVSVPEYFYKALASKDGTRAIAFLLPSDASGDLARYELSIDHLEEISGLNFLAGIEKEAELESSYVASKWDLRAKFAPRPCKSTEKSPFDFASGLQLDQHH